MRPRMPCAKLLALASCSSNANYKIVFMLKWGILRAFNIFVLVLGPCLMFVVASITIGELYAFFTVLLPISAHYGTLEWFLNACFACFLAFCTTFNYYMCVVTNPGTHDSEIYRRLLEEAQELGSLVGQKRAPIRGKQLPTSMTSMTDATSGVSNNAKKKLGSPGESVILSLAKDPSARRTPTSKSWVDQDPYDWGWCRHTQQHKAPRSHFDHVTNKLVLNMDHFCPWMFNCVGFANYRYFFCFLMYVEVACFYGMYLTAHPFAIFMRDRERMRTQESTAGNMDRNADSYFNSVHSEHNSLFSSSSSSSSSNGADIPSSIDTFSTLSRDLNDDVFRRRALGYTFALSMSVGFAVGLLFLWHLYLVLTAQTTIEFYGNATKTYRARAKGTRFRNPYDRGLYKNWCHVFGGGNILIAVLPSTRPPPAAPWPEMAHAAAVVSARSVDHTNRRLGVGVPSHQQQRQRRQATSRSAVVV